MKNIEDIKELLDYKEIYKERDVKITGFSKDSRTIKAGEVYIPIIGERFDGHDFLEDAFNNGAVAALWQADHQPVDLGIPLIIVEDTLKAMQDLAKAYRKKLDIPVVAITGSNGKTTSKDMVRSILARKFKTHASRGNENNNIGLPLTIINAPDDTEVLITEMGTESFGEISFLTSIARPNIAVITNIGDSHLDQLKTKENVAKEKMCIVEGLDQGGVFVYNKDDEYLRKAVESFNPTFKTISFGKTKEAKSIISDIRLEEGRTSFALNGMAYTVKATGAHQAYNAAIAIIVSQILGVDPLDIEEGLNNVGFTGMRNEVTDFEGIKLVDDSYKANPQNLLAAVAALKNYQGHTRRIGVFADMLDLGEEIDKIHEETMAKISQDDFDFVLTYGDHMKAGMKGLERNFPADQIFHFDDKDILFEKLKDLLVDHSLILVKGSRSMHMEDIVEKIKDFAK